MVNKIHLKKSKHISKKTKILAVFILIIILLFYIFEIINQVMAPILLEQADLEINKFSTIIVNKAISQVLEDKINPNEIFNNTISEDGYIQAIDFNPIVVNQILSIATDVVQTNIKLLENGELLIDELSIKDSSKLKKGIIAEVPLGSITKNALFSNLGPKIPIRLNYIGDVASNISTKITQYGINNALVEVGIKLELTAQVILPFMTEKKKMQYDIPVAIKIIQGIVPNYYGNGLVKDSSIYTLPIE